MPTLVLYVEDNAANYSLVRKVLESSGDYRVVGTETGEEGLAMVQGELPAVILLDLDLPGMTGLEFVRALKQDGRAGKVPVVAISASVMKHERENAMKAGCCAFIEKPFDINDLRTMVAQAIAGALDGGSS